MQFQRNTHVNGLFREDLQNQTHEEADKQNRECEGVYHYLSSTDPISFNELVENIQKDDTNFPYPKPGRHEIALWLVRALEFDLVKVVN